MERNSYEIEINGNNYVLKTERSKEETDKIVNYVNNEINEANKIIKVKNPAMTATLACLNIADDLYTVGKDFDSLREISKEPLENYEPLKEKFEQYIEKHKDTDAKMNELENKLFELENSLRLAETQRDNYKLELDRKNNQFKKESEDNEKLRNILLEQEKMTLQAKKQIQELLK